MAAFNGKRVLVINHDTDATHQLQKALARCGYQVYMAQGREDGLPMMYQVQPDLIFLGEVGGRDHSYETFFHIRLFTDNPIILLSSHPPMPDHQPPSECNAMALFEPYSVSTAIRLTQMFFEPEPEVKPEHSASAASAPSAATAT